MNKEKPNFYDFAKRIDKLINSSTIKDETINLALQVSQTNKSLLRYFISSLIRNEKLSWFPLLLSKGFFNDLISKDTKDTNLFPCLNKLDYVKICFDAYPKQTFNLISQIKPGNQYLFNELIVIISKQETSKIPEYIEILKNWFRTNVRIETKEYLRIIDKLEDSNNWEEAKIFVKYLLSPNNTENAEENFPYSKSKYKSNQDLYIISSFMQDLFTKYVINYPNSLLDIATSCIKNNKYLEGEISYWRSAIEEHDQNMANSYEDYLVIIIRDALSTLILNDIKTAQKMLNEFLHESSPIYHRFVIYLVSKNFKKFPKITENLVNNRKYLENNEYHHEYWNLINKAFINQSKETKTKFLEYLIKNFDNERDKYHLLRWFWAVKDSFSGKYEKRYQELINEIGEPEHPDFLTYHKSLGGPLSPVDKEEFLEMTRNEIIEVLNLDIPEEAYGEVAQEGFVLVLQEAVMENPAKFAEISEVFDPTKIPPMYVYHFIQGLRNGWKSGTSFSLKPVFKHLKKLLPLSDIDIYHEKSNISLRSVLMRDIRRSILRLLSSTVTTKENLIEEKYLPELRGILLESFNYLEIPEYNKDEIKNTHLGIITQAINENRSIAVETLLNYALHFSNIKYGKPSQKENKLEDEVKGKLDEILNAKENVVVHSILGKYFPNLLYLDEEWSKHNIQKIFPLQESCREQFVAAWGSYLFRRDFFDNSYKTIRNQYKLGLKLYFNSEDYGTGLEEAIKRIYIHLYFAFWRDLEPMFGKDSLIQTFIKNAPDPDMSNFISGLGSGLKVEKLDKDSPKWLDLKQLWKERFTYLKNQPKENVQQELSAYLSWVPFIPEDLKQYYKDIQLAAEASSINLIFDLLEHLKQTQDYIPFAVGLLNYTVMNTQEYWGIYRRDELFAHILEKGMKLEGEAREDAIQAINRLGELGFEQYRPLLDIE